MESLTQHDVVCYGEVLWDILPNQSLPGGAPMNVAYHLKKLGHNPTLITKIGIDDYGKKLVNLLEKAGISTDFFSIDYKHSTGLVYAKPNEYNEVTYEIINPVAWDYIEWEDEFTDLIAKSDFFVYGSLASRNKLSRETLYQLLDLANTKVLAINLQAPHFNRSHVEYLLQKADILRMNMDELELITGWFSHFKNTIDRIQLIQDQFKIDTVIVTMGKNGAMVNNNGAVYTQEAYNVKVTDTMGTGDAFLAGFIHNLSKGNGIEQALRFASAMGAYMATCSGACPQYHVSNVEDLMFSVASKQTFISNS